MSGSVSGLSKPHRINARDRAVEAWALGYKHRDQITYTQDRPSEIRAQGGRARRWDGIRLHCNARNGQFPRFADCSSYATWGLWNGLFLPYDVRDVVNGQRWHAGFTGTMLQNGKQVHHLDNVQRADLVIYGNGGSGKHVAGVAGRRKSDNKIMVFSHGSSAGPFYLPYDYRSDIMQFRRYI